MGEISKGRKTGQDNAGLPPEFRRGDASKQDQLLGYWGYWGYWVIGLLGEGLCSGG